MVKSYKVLGLLRRVLPSVHCPWAKKVLYITLVRFYCFTSLPSAVLICHLQLAPRKQRLQRWATKFILNHYVSNYRLCFLDLHLLYITIDGPLYPVLRKAIEHLSFITFCSDQTRSASHFKLRHTILFIFISPNFDTCLL